MIGRGRDLDDFNFGDNIRVPVAKFKILISNAQKIKDIYGKYSKICHHWKILSPTHVTQIDSAI